MSEQHASRLPDRLTYVPVPLQALHAAVADIDDLVELKVVLTLFRSQARQRPMAKWVTPRELLDDPALQEGLDGMGFDQRVQALAGALKRGCERGILVCARHPRADVGEPRYGLNTPANRRALAAAGWQADEPPNDLDLEPSTDGPRPNIFQLYEQNIGLLTPLLADELREAEAAYPAEWVEQAFREAVGYNKRSWRYVKRVLENWAVEGRGEGGAPRRYAEAARTRLDLGRFRPTGR